MNLRRLRDPGVLQFSDYLAALREDSSRPVPQELLDDPRFTELAEPTIEVERQSFATKLEAGEYLHKCLRLPASELRSDVGLWAWLAVFFFDQLCPPDGHGRRHKENAKYISIKGDHRFGLDKHLLFFPWKMYSLHPEAMRFFLSDPVGADSRAQREWTGYYLNLCKPLLEVGARLYGDLKTGKLKRGATSTSSSRKGTLRALLDRQQLEVTYDLSGMTPEELLRFFPKVTFAGGWNPSPWTHPRPREAEHPPRRSSAAMGLI